MNINNSHDLPQQEDQHFDDITIQRCPHDPQNPYTMILNSLIRDQNISPNCRWLIIYLLSNKDGWKINVKQIINHVKDFMGRDKVYDVVKEAIEAGYMKKEIIKDGNLKQEVKYFVSETPKFKKCFRHPPFQDTEIRETENTYIKKEHPERKTKEQQQHSENAACLLSDLPLTEEEKRSLTSSFKPEQLKRIETFYKAKIEVEPNFIPNKGWCAFLAASIHKNWPIPEKLVTSETIRNEKYEKPPMSPDEIETNKQAAAKFQDLFLKRGLTTEQVRIRENAIEYKKGEKLIRLCFNVENFLQKLKDLYKMVEDERKKMV